MNAKLRSIFHSLFSSVFTCCCSLLLCALFSEDHIMVISWTMVLPLFVIMFGFCFVLFNIKQDTQVHPTLTALQISLAIPILLWFVIALLNNQTIDVSFKTVFRLCVLSIILFVCVYIKKRPKSLEK